MAGDLEKIIKDHPVVTLVSFVVGIGIGLYALVSWVDSRVENAVMDEAFLRKVSARVRPYCILDHKGVILFDGGALDFLDEIKVENHPVGPNLPVRIILKPKKYLVTGPLLSSIDGLSYELVAERGVGTAWVYHLTNYFLSTDIPAQGYRFRLEILY